MPPEQVEVSIAAVVKARIMPVRRIVTVAAIVTAATIMSIVLSVTVIAG